ncbi:MAG: hypothetical protein PW792_08260 [Acidobacteriaceae bacterium]|nr:hypothetical protein [Acidobacteriaceae bacterium]
MATATQTFQLGLKATLSVSTTSTGTFTPVNKLSKITFGADKVDYIDVTDLNAPSGVTGGQPRKQSAPGLITPGDVTVTGFLIPAGDPGQLLVTAAFDVQTLLYWQLQFAPVAGQTTGALQTFVGYVSTRPTMDASMTDAVTFNFTVQQTDAPTYTAGS